MLKFTYHGKEFIFKKDPNEDNSHYMRCPKCNKFGFLNSSSGGHEILQTEPLTIRPSVVCPHKECTYHVWVTEGVAVDC